MKWQAQRRINPDGEVRGMNQEGYAQEGWRGHCRGHVRSMGRTPPPSGGPRRGRRKFRPRQFHQCTTTLKERKFIHHRSGKQGRRFGYNTVMPHWSPHAFRACDWVSESEGGQPQCVHDTPCCPVTSNGKEAPRGLRKRQPPSHATPHL